MKPVESYDASELFAELKAHRRARALKTAGAAMFAIAALCVTWVGASATLLGMFF